MTARMTKQKLSTLNGALSHYLESIEEEYENCLPRWEFDEDYENDPDYKEMNRRLSEVDDIIEIVNRKWKGDR